MDLNGRMVVGRSGWFGWYSPRAFHALSTGKSTVKGGLKSGFMNGLRPFNYWFKPVLKNLIPAFKFIF